MPVVRMTVGASKTSPICDSTPRTAPSSTIRRSTLAWRTCKLARALDHALAARAIRGLVGLRAAGAHGGAFARVEKSKLDSGLVDRQAHLAAERVDLADQVALADPADRGVAGHLADVVEVEREHQRARAHPRRGQRGFDSGSGRRRR